MADFAERIRELRHKQGMTQQALGKIIDVRQDTISIYETGKHYPEVRNLMILADYFGVSTDYLLGRTDNPEINR
ncbi:MAG: helix-turn-helix transcriptional regulator [Oscillibacter sp.]|nr:helix-turn-helix transcriptional regulator [Oscillibacter sp.]